MDMEKPEERLEGPFAKAQVIDAFESGDSAEGWRRFEDWYQLKQSETDKEDSAGRIRLAIDTMEVHDAAGEKDILVLQFDEIEQTISSDQTLSDAEREELADRLSVVWARFNS